MMHSAIWFSKRFGLDGMAGTGLEYMEQELSFGERSINVGINGCLMLGMIIPLQLVWEISKGMY